ncbi:MAG TPA: hypothetical protein PLP18_11460 [Smithellaceae bacterium]|nr:hypothetical protein [Smithellaceae bacterium]
MRIAQSRPIVNGYFVILITSVVKPIRVFRGQKTECLRLRVQDLDFGQNLIFVRGGKGGKDRTTVLPKNLRDGMPGQISAVKALHHRDLEEASGMSYPGRPD